MTTPKILIVDDDDDFCVFVEHRIREVYGKVQIQIVHDGAAALRKFISWKPHLVILDIVMPGLDGLKLIREMKSSRLSAGAKILATSGLVNGIGSKALAAGSSAFFRKREGMEELVESLPEYLPTLKQSRLASRLKRSRS